MSVGTGAGDRIERFLSAHSEGRLLVCVGSASVPGLVWLAERTRQRPVTLLIGDLQGRNFQHATDVDRRTAVDFVERSDVEVRNWYRTARNAAGRSEAHLKIWAAFDDHENPQAFLLGSANLTAAGLSENAELMAVADASEHDYLRSTVAELLEKAWSAEEQLVERIAGTQAVAEPERPHKRTPKSGQHRSSEPAGASKSGCANKTLAMAVVVLGLAAATFGFLPQLRGLQRDWCRAPGGPQPGPSHRRGPPARS
ncbi:hypothetical protein [Candidatus Poriferisodalis sp.]|uniref:hypothetical protein n=1 Tax=Candidatus Poriferisodalis sp. TaxID=3101277 RepID=UPI003D14D572